MPPFLLALLAFLKPLLDKLFDEWLSSEMVKAEKKLSKAKKLTGLSDGAKSRLVLEAVLAGIPLLQRRKRAFVRAALQEVPPLIEAGKKKLPEKVKTELTGYAGDMEDEE